MTELDAPTIVLDDKPVPITKDLIDSIDDPFLKNIAIEKWHAWLKKVREEDKRTADRMKNKIYYFTRKEQAQKWREAWKQTKGYRKSLRVQARKKLIKVANTRAEAFHTSRNILKKHKEDIQELNKIIRASNNLLARKKNDVLKWEKKTKRQQQLHKKCQRLIAYERSKTKPKEVQV
jgi:hypothetical protein